MPLRPIRLRRPHATGPGKATEMSRISGGRAMALLKPCVRASAGRIAAGLVFACLAAGTSLCIPWTIKLAVDDVFTRRTIAPAAFAGGLLLLYLLRNVFVLVGRRTMLSVGERTALMARQLTFERLQSLSTEAAGGRTPGESLSRITGDVSQLEGFFETGIPKMFTTLLLLVAVVAVIFLMNPTLAAMSLSVMPLHLALYIGMKKRIKRGNRRMREGESGLAGGLVESLLGARAMAASTAEDIERRRFYERANELLDSRLRLGSLRLWQKVLADIVVALGTAGIYFYGGRLVTSGAMESGEFFAFVGYLGMLYPLSLTVMTQTSHTLGTMASAERIMELLEKTPEVADAPDATPLPQVAGSVRFDQVGFSFGRSTSGIHGLTASIRPGELVAVRGPVGSGKSTLASLLARFYDATHGTIFLDDVPLASLPLAQLRRVVGIAFQEPFIFSGTIADNIRYSKPDASEWEVAEAAEAVGLTPMIAAFPDGLDTPVGDGGMQLSLGQKRRIDLARAFIKDPRVLVLDSLFVDGDDEHRFQEGRILARISRGRTTFVIDPPPFIAERATTVITLRRDGTVAVEQRAANSAATTHAPAGDASTVTI